MSSKFRLAEDSENLIHRMVNDERQIEIGIYRVLFGYRVRAGFIDAGSCRWDWCCGQSHKFLTLAYRVGLASMKADIEGYPFESLPATSKVKPIFLDYNFMSLLMDRAGQLSLEEIELPSLIEIEERWRVFFNANHLAFIDSLTKDG